MLGDTSYDEATVLYNPRANKVFTSIFTCSFYPYTVGYHSEDFEHKLIHDLFKSGYSKEALPVRNKSEAIEVMFDMAYSQLIYLVRKQWTHILTRYLFKMRLLIPY